MKKLILVIVVLLSGCSSEQLDIGLVLYNEADPFVDMFAEQIKERIDKLIKNISKSQKNKIELYPNISKRVKIDFPVFKKPSTKASAVADGFL